MLHMFVRPKLHPLKHPEPARIKRLQIRLRKHAVHPEHPLDRNIERSLLLDLANQTILKTLTKCEMPSGQIPTPRPIQHPRRAPKHQNPPAISNHPMDTDKELLLRHKIKLTARESSPHMERGQSSLYKN